MRPIGEKLPIGLVIICMNTGTVGILAVVAVLISGYKQILEALRSFSDFVLGRVDLDKRAASAVYSYCIANMDMINLRNRTLMGYSAIIKSKKREGLVAFDLLAYNTVVFRKGFNFLAISPGPWYYSDTLSKHEQGITLWIPRFIWNQDKFLKDCLDSFDDRLVIERRFNITKFYGGTKTTFVTSPQDRKDRLSSVGAAICEAHLGRAIPFGYQLSDISIGAHDSNPFDRFPFPTDVMDIVDEVRFWRESQLWYSERSIPWRFGLMLHGLPGSGKTMLIRCIAQELDLPIFIFDLASMSNEEFNQSWSQLSEQQPCIALFEDFDNVFNGRANVVKDHKLTFDCVINAISGVDLKEGVLLAITTNDLSKIDSAIGIPDESETGIPTRPGRIDRILELGLMDRDCRKKFAGRALKDLDIDMGLVLDDTEDMTAAQLVEYCRRLNLSSSTLDRVLV